MMIYLLKSVNINENSEKQYYDKQNRNMASTLAHNYVNEAFYKWI